MYQPITLYVIFRYIFGKELNYFSRIVSWFSSIGIMFGVISLISVLSVMNGIEDKIKNNFLQFTPQVLLTTTMGKVNTKHFPSSFLKSLHGVINFAPITIGNVLLYGNNHKIMNGVMLGINPEDPEPIFNYLKYSKHKKLISGKYGIILGNHLAMQLGVKIGEKIRLITPEINQLTPIGRVLNQRLFTIIDTFFVNNEIDSYQLFVNQKDAERLMFYSIGEITGWRLWLENPLLVDQCSSQSIPNGLLWKDWRDKKGELFDAMKIEKNTMGILLSLIIIISSLNIIISIGLSIIEKQSDIAILKTQGMKQNQILLIFILQGFIFSIIGIFFGIIIGILFVYNLHLLVPFIVPIKHAVLPVIIKSKQIIYIALYTISTTLFFSFLPSIYATKISPAKVLKYE